MKKYVTITIAMFAFWGVAFPVSAQNKPEGGKQPPLKPAAIPIDTITTDKCTEKTENREIIMKFSGVRIDKDGSLKLKRNIRFKSTAGGNEGPEDVGEEVPDDSSPFSEKTPFDVVIGVTGGGNLQPIKLVVRKGVGAKFISETINNKEYPYI